jgi:ribosomal protein S27E
MYSATHADRNNNGVLKKMQICLECGKETKNKKFCSIECRSKYITKHSKKQVSCEICGKIL